MRSRGVHVRVPGFIFAGDAGLANLKVEQYIGIGENKAGIRGLYNAHNLDNPNNDSFGIRYADAHHTINHAE